jgi:hypothetical protein
MDDQRLFAEEWIGSAVRRAVSLGTTRPIGAVLMPDWTADLMRQPRNADADHRRASAGRVAPALVAAALALAGQTPVVALWVPDPAIGEVYRAELTRALSSPHAVAA